MLPLAATLLACLAMIVAVTCTAIVAAIFAPPTPAAAAAPIDGHGNEQTSRPQRSSPTDVGPGSDLTTDADRRPDTRPATQSEARPASRGAARVDPDDAFHVKIDRVRPGTLPAKGNIRLSGTVTNLSDETRTGLNVHPLSSSYPITTSDELAAAVEASPEITFGGVRLLDIELLDNSIDSLAPEETRRWSITLPIDKLSPGADGVYVLGVQVLADNADGGRDGLADGRARTFVPRVTGKGLRTPASLVVPLRADVQHTSNGAIADPAKWETELSDGGRLANLATLLEESFPVSVSLDPAVLDTTTHLRDGNHPRSIAPTVAEAEGPDVDEAEEADGTTGGQTSEGSVSSLSTAAGDWQTRLVDSLGSHDVLALPYGDLDVAAAARWSPGELVTARRSTEEVLSEHDIDSRFAVIPGSGLLAAETVGSLPEDTTVVLNATATESSTRGAVRVGDNTALLATDVSGAADPQDPDSATGLRQRILAEAAVRALADDAEPLIVNLPDDFDPGIRIDQLIDGLDASYVNWRPLKAPSRKPVAVEELNYPPSEAEAEVGQSSFQAAHHAVQRATVLEDVLPLNDTIRRTVQRETLIHLARPEVDDDPWRHLTDMAEWIDQQLSLVTINAPSFVILSSETGPFSLTVSNGIDQPVRFSIRARTADGVVIQAPDEVELEAGASRTIRMEATSRTVGVHEVNLELISSTGIALNEGEQLNIRSNSVGKIIWVVLASALGVLAIIVPLRIYRRVRKVRGEPRAAGGTG